MPVSFENLKFDTNEEKHSEIQAVSAHLCGLMDRLIEEDDKKYSELIYALKGAINKLDDGLDDWVEDYFDILDTETKVQLMDELEDKS